MLPYVLTSVHGQRNLPCSPILVVVRTIVSAPFASFRDETLRPAMHSGFGISVFRPGGSTRSTRSVDDRFSYILAQTSLYPGTRSFVSVVCALAFDDNVISANTPNSNMPALRMLTFDTAIFDRGGCSCWTPA